MRGARRAETTEDGSDTDENGINAAMCINAWTRVRHWSAPERVPVVGTSEEAGTMDAAAAAAKEKSDLFSTGAVNDDQLDLFFSSDLKMRLSGGGGLAKMGTVAPPPIRSLETATRTRAVPAFTWAREAMDRRRRLTDFFDAEDPRPNNAAVNDLVVESDNERLPTAQPHRAPMPREATSSSPAWADVSFSPNCRLGNDLAKMERILPADMARPCPEWKRRKKRKSAEQGESKHWTEAAVTVESEEVNVLRDPSPLVPEGEVLSSPKLESQSCHVPLSNCNAVSEKSSYVRRGWPPRSGICRHKCGASLGWGHAKANWVTLLSLLTLTCSVFVAPCGAKICNSVQLKENMSEWQTLLGNCTVIEGSLVITTGMRQVTVEDRDIMAPNISFPMLREITDFLVVFKAKRLKSLGGVFPNLSVIRGNQLQSDYALVVYKNENLEEIGLSGLTKILKGGVRVSNNKKLCYAETVDWEDIIDDASAKKSGILVSANMDENFCADVCPNHCSKMKNGKASCWNSRECQRKQVQCPPDTPANKKCYHLDSQKGINGERQMTACNAECIGGCFGDEPTDCFACEGVFYKGSSSTKDENTCLAFCPHPFLKFKNWRCITRLQCKGKVTTFPGASIQDKNQFKSYNEECIEYCPADTKEKELDDRSLTCETCENCPKECVGGLITSLDELKKFQGCTMIRGDLAIQLSGYNVVQQLEQYLGRVKEITGALKISHSYPIVSLDFFSSLETIRGESDGNPSKKAYSLHLLQNENLARLFPVQPDGSTVRIFSKGASRGNAFIHYNGKLCRSEIEKMIQNSKMEEPNSADISFATNGDQGVCSRNKLNVSITSMSPRILMLYFDNYQGVIANDNKDYRALLGYQIHYRKIDRWTFEAKNLTKYEGRDACGGDDWVVIDHMPSAPTIQDGKEAWPREGVWVTPLDPYNYYAFFVTTMLMREFGEERVHGAESDMVYYLTDEDYPDPPQSIEVEKTNYSSLSVSWLPPKSPNGIIDHYDIVLQYKRINIARTHGRDFCEDGATDMADIEKKEARKGEGEEEEKEEEEGMCPCNTCASQKEKPVPEDQHRIDGALEDHLIDLVFSQNGNRLGKKRKKRAIITDVANEQLIPLDQDDVDMDRVFGAVKSNNFTIVDGIPVRTIEDSEENPEILIKSQHGQEKPMPKRQVVDAGGVQEFYYWTYSEQISGDKLLSFIGHLKHYGSYTLRIRACHKPYKEGKETQVGENARQAVERYVKRCSRSIEEDVRVLHKPGADDIPGDVPIKVIRQQQNKALDEANGARNRNSSNSDGNEDFMAAKIHWEPPRDPNEFIANYRVRIRHNPDGEGISKDSITCVNARDFEAMGHIYKLEFPGSYWVAVQAKSAFGFGNWTKDVYVTVPDKNTTFLLSVVLPIVGILLLIVAATCFLYNRYGPKPSGGPDIGPSPIYSKFEYQQDDWEVHRDNVKLGDELGSGTFGKVFSGIYHDPETGAPTSCAVKAVKEEADYNTVRVFLSEAEFMKPISTEHVVKLVGVVSVSMPHLILMELGTEGDLRAWLMKHRPGVEANQTGRQPPRVSEVKLMALQIADGMAFLSSIRPKAIVHRDLAARNCLVFPERVVKVADFGMARETYVDDMYQMNSRRLMPVRWMAPESLKDGISNSQSDVWSFGVVLWEIVTLGELPYQGKENDEVLHCVTQGVTLPRPMNSDGSNGDEELWLLMKSCWQMWPSKRPTFLEICHSLLKHADQRFLDKSFVTSEAGRAAFEAFEEDKAAREAEEERLATEAEDETRQFLPARNGNNHSGGSASGGDHENGQVSSGSGSAMVELRQLNRQVSAPPTSNSGGLLLGNQRSSASVLAGFLSGGSGDNSGGGSGGSRFIPKITAAMPNGFMPGKKRNKSGGGGTGGSTSGGNGTAVA